VAVAAVHAAVAADPVPAKTNIRNELPRRKRTGYRIPKYKIGNAASRGVFNSNRNKGLPLTPDSEGEFFIFPANKK